MMSRRTLIAPFAVVALLMGGLLTSVGSVGAQNNAGTVKIFDGDKELPANDPKVCGPFTVQGLNFEAGESVDISIIGHGGPNAGAGSFSATVTVAGDGTFATGPITLPVGMYKLDSEDGEGGGDKNKVFKVECEGVTPPGEPPTVTPPGGEQLTPPAGAQAVQAAPAPTAVLAQPRTTG
jgi:hypothetical protein